MKITVKLLGEDRVVHKAGKINYEKIDRVHIVEYNGHVYAFEKNENVTTALFRECGTAMLLMDKDFI